MVLEELIVVHNNMEKMWVDEGKTEPFPLEWNQIKNRLIFLNIPL